jgi:hypothetical protein
MESYRNPVGMVDHKLTFISLGIFLVHSHATPIPIMNTPIPIMNCDMKQGMEWKYSSGIQQEIPGMTSSLTIYVFCDITHDISVTFL